jgi:hypothetical protein
MADTPVTLSKLTRKRIIRHGRTLYIMRRKSDRTYLLVSFSTLTYGRGFEAIR